MYSLHKIFKSNFVNLNLNKIQFFSSNGKNSKKYDIVIAGGGMIGTSLACTLGKNLRLSGKKILLLESTKDVPFVLSEKYSNRVISVTPGTKLLLNQIGVWKHIENSRVAIVKRLQVMDALSDASLTLGEETSHEDISYIVENNLLLDSVKKEIKDIGNVEILYGVEIKSYNFPSINEEYTSVCLDDGATYTCELLVGCDGVNSRVRNAMGVHYLNWKYNNMGIVATLNFSEKFQNCVAWQRWLPTGPLALLPLNSSQSSLVWSTTVEDAKRLKSLTNEQFVDALNEAFWKVFKRNEYIDRSLRAFENLLRATNISVDVHRRYPPKISCVEEGSRAAFPLGFGHATNYIGKGVVLVGDAAHRVHPLAGQGVNLGFGDISYLNNILGEAVYSGSSLGNVSYLKKYEAERQKHNVAMMVAIEGLYRIYNTDIAPVVLLRGLGVQAVDALGSIKKMAINYASNLERV